MTTSTTPPSEVQGSRAASVDPRRPRVPWPAKFTVLAVIWGSSFLLMKIGLDAMAPLQIAAVRTFSGAAVLLVLLRITRSRLPRERRVWAHLAVSSVLLTVLPFTLFAFGETLVSSALAGIGNASTPLATVLFGALLLPSDRLTGRQVAAVIIGFLGVVTIMQPWAIDGRPNLLGFGMTLVAGASYGLGWTYNRRFLAGADLGGLAQPAALLSVGAVLTVPVLVVWWLVADIAAPWTLHAAGSAVVGPLFAVLALGVVGTGLAYMLQYDVVRAAGPTVSATVTYLIPVVAVGLGVLFLREHLAWPQLLGAAIVLSAAVVIGRPAKKPLPSQA